jgi:hypothetical protein
MLSVVIRSIWDYNDSDFKFNLIIIISKFSSFCPIYYILVLNYKQFHELLNYNYTAKVYQKLRAHINKRKIQICLIMVFTHLWGSL